MALKAFTSGPYSKSRTSSLKQCNLQMKRRKQSQLLLPLDPTFDPRSPHFQAQFRSSCSQTTFLDRNIVQNLAVAASAPLNSSSSKVSSVCTGGGMTNTTAVAGGTGTGSTAPRVRRRPRTVPASYTSSCGSGKRASFSGTLPDGKLIFSNKNFFSMPKSKIDFMNPQKCGTVKCAAFIISRFLLRINLKVLRLFFV